MPTYELRKEELPWIEVWAKIIYNNMYKRAKMAAIDWSNMERIREECIRRGGYPMFKTRYAGNRFPDPEHPNKFMVLMVCWGREQPPMKAVWFDNVSLEDIEELERT